MNCSSRASTDSKDNGKHAMNTISQPHLSVNDERVGLRSTSGQDRILAGRKAGRYARRTAIALVVTLAVTLLAWIVLHFRGAQTSVDRSRIVIARVQRGSFLRDVAADGQVIAAVSPTLYASAAGSVTLKAHAGDVVTLGQVLAVIDSPDLTTRLSQEEATLQGLRLDWRRAQLDAKHRLAQLGAAYQQAQVDQKTAQRELERTRKAFELGAYSELQVLRAQDALEKAQFAFDQTKLSYESQPEQNRFDIDSKKASLDRQEYLVNELRRQVSALQIRSPVNGKLGQVQVADRAEVAKDVPLLTVVDLSALEVEIKVPETLARDLKSGMSADLESSGRHWQGSVGALSPEVINGQVAARVRFGNDAPADLRQGQRLFVRILIDRRENVLQVDRGTFVDQDGGHFAYVIHDRIAERRPIRLGVASVQKVEILEGLSEGDEIAVSGTDAFDSAPRVILSR
jgi:HlyD family secretion protein